jgi:hypothetical protein
MYIIAMASFRKFTNIMCNDASYMNEALSLINSSFQPIDSTLTALSTLPNSGGYLKNNGSGTLSWDSPISGLTANRVVLSASATTITDNANLTFTSNNLVLGAGYVDAKTFYYLGGNKFISVNGNYHISIGVGAFHLSSAVDGCTAIGGFALAGNTGAYNTAISYNALGKGTSGNYLIAIGVNSQYNNLSASYNIAIGHTTLFTNSTGDSNLAIGFQVLYNCIDGSANNGLGKGSLFNLTHGGINNAYGAYTLYNLTTGSANCCFGYYSGYTTNGSNNVYLGNYSGYSSTGSYNVCIGDDAGRNLQGGNYNTIIGGYAGRDMNATASFNVFIGWNAGGNETGSNLLYIANSATTTPLIYGNFSTPLVRINGRLDVTGAISDEDTSGGVWINKVGSLGGIYGLHSGGGTYNDLEIRCQATAQLYLSTTGKIGIATTGALGALCVNGGVSVGVDTDAGDNNLLVDGNIYIGTTTEYLSNSSNDVLLTTTANKTLKLGTVVYEDLQFPVLTGKVPSSHTPTWETFTTNTNAYSFTVDDYIDLSCVEIPHCWVQGSKGDFHLHVTLKDANSSGANRYAKFICYVAYALSNTTAWSAWTEVSTIGGELTIPTGTSALTSRYLDLGDLTLTGYTVGTQIRVRVKRIAATGGTEYASNIFITQVGCHLQNDTIGSRQETTK